MLNKRAKKSQYNDFEFLTYELENEHRTISDEVLSTWSLVPLKQ